MKVSATFSTMLLAFASFGAQQVSAHGYLVQPLVKFISQNIDITQYSSTIDSYKLFPDGTFNTDPKINIASFMEHLKKSPYKSLKAMINANQVLVSKDATPTCGFTDPDQTHYGALNDTIIFGRSPDVSIAEGFVHPGPCETWCDDNQVQQNMHCDEAYNPKSGGGGAPMPIKKAACANAKRLTFYWIGMHGPTWQVYVNCVNINGNTSKSGTGSSPTTSTTTNSQTTPSTTAPTTTTGQATTPKATPATPDVKNTTPGAATTASTPAPVATTPTPTTASSDVGNEASVSADKCLRRRTRD